MPRGRPRGRRQTVHGTRATNSVASEITKSENNSLEVAQANVQPLAPENDVQIAMEAPGLISYDQFLGTVAAEETNPARWMKKIQRDPKGILFYQYKVVDNLPRISKSVLIEEKLVHVDEFVQQRRLCPTVFIGDKQMGVQRIIKVIGQDYLYCVMDLTKLLETVDSMRSINDNAALVQSASVSPGAYSPASTPQRDSSISSGYGSRKYQRSASTDSGDTDKDSVKLRIGTPASSGDGDYTPKKSASKSKKKRPFTAAAAVPTSARAGSARKGTVGNVTPPASTVAKKVAEPNPKKRAQTSSGHRRVGDPNGPTQMMRSIILYRQIFAEVSGQDIDTELGEMSRTHAMEVNAAFKIRSGYPDSVLSSRLQEARFGARSLPVWLEFKALYDDLEDNCPEVLNTTNLNHFREFLCKLPDNAAIDLLRQCRMTRSFEALKVAYSQRPRKAELSMVM